MLAEDKDALVVLMSTLTWCRPCKGLAKPFQVACPHTCIPSLHLLRSIGLISFTCAHLHAGCTQGQGAPVLVASAGPVSQPRLCQKSFWGLERP